MTAGLLQAGTGCIISGDDDDGDDVIVDDGDDLGDDVGDDGTGDGILYQVSWICPPDAIDIEFTYTPVGSATSLRTDNFACENGDVGADILLDPGEYDVDIIPVGDIGTFAGVTDVVEGGDGSLVVRDYVDFPDDAGYFFLTWTIDGDDPAIVCPEIGGDGVSLLATLIDPEEAFDDIFECDPGEATTAELPIGDYVLDLTVIDADEVVIADTPTIEDSIEFGDELRDVGDFDFELL